MRPSPHAPRKETAATAAAQTLNINIRKLLSRRHPRRAARLLLPPSPASCKVMDNCSKINKIKNKSPAP